MHRVGIEFLRATTVAVVFLGVASIAGSGQLVEIHLERSEGGRVPVTVRAWEGDGPFVTAAGTAPGVVEIEVGAGRVWTFEVEGESVWGPPRTLFVDPGDRRVHLDVLDAAPISGTLTVGDNESIPETVVLSASPVSEERGGGLPSLWQRVCAVGSDGQFSCLLPIGDLDLKLRAQTYLSHFRWGLQLSQGGFDFGVVRLVPGASVIVEVFDRDGKPQPDTLVELLTAKGGERGGTDSHRHHRTTTNERGVTCFEKVDSGHWVVRASRKGMAPTVSPPIHVLPRTEVSLRDPLILDEPTTVSVVVSPAATPRGGPWQVSIRGESRSTPQSELGPTQLTDPGGWVHWDGVPRRPVVIQVTDGDGGLWYTESIDPVTDPQPIEVHLEAVRVRGRVNEPSPISGILVWRTRPGDGPVRAAHVPIDPEGEYSAVLPAAGEWLVAVRGEDGRHSESIIVEVPATDGSEPAVVDLSFSARVVSGRVVDHEGRNVAGARITAAPADAAALEETGSVSSALTDAEGEFVINANLGRTLLTATGPDGASATIEITANKREPERVEMRLPKPGMLRGRILLDGQPAPGVTVFALPTDSGPAVLEPHQSDASGRFEIQLPSPGQVSLISIPSRGGACVQTAYPGGEEELVSLSGHSGVLEVRWKAAGGVRPFLRMGRAVVGLELLVMFSPGRGGLSEAGRIVVPNLSCDRYEICLPPEPGQAVTPSCRPVDVLPGGHTIIDFQEDG